MIGLYFMVGIGTAFGLHVDLTERYPSQWRGATRVAGLVMLILFWPVVLVTLMTLILCRLADR